MLMVSSHPVSVSVSFSGTVGDYDYDPSMSMTDTVTVSVGDWVTQRRNHCDRKWIGHSHSVSDRDPWVFWVSSHSVSTE